MVLAKACDICQELQNDNLESTAQGQLKEVARRLRYQIATREPFVPDETSDLQVATLWGAKGVTADHVYVIGLCKEAIPGIRHEAYPGTDLEFREEQRRLFYVSITRSKKTLVLSRANSIARGQAKQLGLQVSQAGRRGLGQQYRLRMLAKGDYPAERTPLSGLSLQLRNQVTVPQVHPVKNANRERDTPAGVQPHQLFIQRHPTLPRIMEYQPEGAATRAEPAGRSVLIVA